MLLGITINYSFIASAATNGKCGENLYWNYDKSTYTLTINGTGFMDDYEYTSKSPYNLYSYCNYPWYEQSRDIKHVVINSGVTNVSNHAFFGFINLIDVIIPDGVTIIDDAAFSSCIKLTTVNIPDSVTTIGKGTFANCHNLTNITLSDSTISIEENAFAGCWSITTIRITMGITKISDYAFYECKNLESIIIPNSVKTIGEYSFELNDALKNIYYTGTEDEWNNIQIGMNNQSLLNANIIFHLNHVYSIIDELDKTCLSNGYITYKCECGEEYIEIIEFGHECESFIFDVDNVLHYRCSVCNNEYIKAVDAVFLKWNINSKDKELDVVNDDIINAKDYAKLLSLSNYGY